MIRRSIKLAVFSVGCLFLAGCASRPPGKIETKVVNGIKHHLTVGEKSLHDPFPQTPESLAEGQKQFENYCTSCHGFDGRNSGVLFAEHVSPPIPPLDAPEVQSFSDGQLHWIIRNGVSPSGMPAWASNLEDRDIWNIVQFLRTLPKKQP